MVFCCCFLCQFSLRRAYLVCVGVKVFVFDAAFENYVGVMGGFLLCLFRGDKILD